MANFSRITLQINEAIDLSNYTCSLGYLLLPAISEYTWNLNVRIVLYLLGLLWCFLGVAYLADIFMAAIERITSKTTVVKISDPESPGGYREVQIKVWNDTVANLSLLALGTSSPEILLSIIEITGNNFESGELGPGTIVGSAAFNLLFICAICMSCVPDGETRRIQSFKVFLVTSFSCVFAYVWMVIVIVVISPDVVDIWEAVLTFAFFPILLLVAYAAEKNFFMKKEDMEEKHVVGIPLVTTNGDVITANETHANDVIANGDVVITDETHANNDDAETKHDDTDSSNSAVSSHRSSHRGKGPHSIDSERHRGKGHTSGQKQLSTVESTPVVTNDEGEIRKLATTLAQSDLTPDQIADILARRAVDETPHSRAFYRSNAIRGLTGAKKLISQTGLDMEGKISEEKRLSIKKTKSEVLDPSRSGKLAVVEFTSAAVAVLENEGKVRLGIKRTGNLTAPVSVSAQTVNGTALAGEDFQTFDRVLEFEENETLKQIFIEIIDDNIWEPDEIFFVKLKVESPETTVLGLTSICEVTIINDDDPGIIEFTKPSYMTRETDENVMIPVIRKNGADGQVEVTWVTKENTAIEGKDYVGTEGKFTFYEQEIRQNIVIPLISSHKSERDDNFQIMLTSASNGAVLGKLNKTIVTIISDDDFNGLVSRIVNMTKANQEALELHNTTLAQQFLEAMNVNGGDIENATFMSYVLHFLSFFWKFLFAFIPPTHIMGGWATFFTSLALIGLVTAIIGDLAGIFGCLIGLEDTITAITLVALGTSMPDTFASKTAAIMEKTADNSIGNVNGSNSVNVFLGLGLPWMMASVFHYMKGDAFRVPAGALGFSVIIYSLIAVVAIAILIWRRMSSRVGAELGGPKGIKIVCSIVFLIMWVFYVVISTLQTKGIIHVQIGH